ncbi:MAG TPA: STAS domain-containing protein [Solirubrobacterales bacterium]|nr:STAS domain-containing protein [Solirubrobacterales bacterium]
MRAFKLIEEDLRPDCRRIQVEGELDLAVAEQLAEALVRVGAECREVLIDLERCEFIDSTGIAAIVHAHKRLAEQGVRAVACAPSAQVLRVLSVSGLTSNGLVFDNVEEALSPIAPAETAT